MMVATAEIPLVYWRKDLLESMIVGVRMASHSFSHPPLATSMISLTQPLFPSSITGCFFLFPTTIVGSLTASPSRNYLSQSFYSLILLTGKLYFTLR